MSGTADWDREGTGKEEPYRVFWSDDASYFLGGLPEKQRHRIVQKVRKNLSVWPEAWPLMPQTHSRYKCAHHILVPGPPDFQVVFRVNREARQVYIVLIYYARGQGP